MSDEKNQITPEEELRLKGAQDEGSLSSIMEGAPHPVFTGHPATMGETFEGPSQEEMPPEAPPEKTEKPPERTEEKPPERKYKSWEEAEAGAAAHQRFATEKAEEAARLREENEALKSQHPGKENPPETPPEKTSEEFEAEREARIETALEEIGNLDEFAPDYKKQVARAWLKAGFGGGSPMPEAELLEKVWGKIEERLAERERPKEEVNVRQRAEELATAEGLDMGPGTAANILFWVLAKEAPEAPFEDQVKWTAEEVRKKLGPSRPGMTEAEKALAEKARLNNAPLERGGSPPPATKPKEDKGYTLGGILNDQMHARII